MPLIVAAAALAMSVQTSPIAIIPKPVTVLPLKGTFRLDAHTSISAENSLGDVAHYLQRTLSPATGYYMPIAYKALDTIELRIDRHMPNVGPEGYVLHVTKDKVVI